MTGVHPSGTDRIAEAVAGRSDWEFVVNVQGDEPMLSGANIDTLVEGMRERPEVGMATLCRPMSAELVEDPNAVKVVRRSDGRALYFSRSADSVSAGSGSCRGPLWRLHLGIYGFRPEDAERFRDDDAVVAGASRGAGTAPRARKRYRNLGSRRARCGPWCGHTRGSRARSTFDDEWGLEEGA